MPSPTNMNGKAALVTGAASGLGRATALVLARAGADVCIVDLNAAGLEETAEQIRAAGAKALVHAADLSVAEQCPAAVAAAVAAFGRLDALCNVAGLIFFANSHEMPLAEWNKTIAVNLTAPFLLSQAAIPHLLEQNGAIVNVTSAAAFAGKAYVAAYCASKAGLTHMTKAMAMEYSHKPIRINAVAPGGMLTAMGDSIRIPEDADRALLARFGGLRGVVEVEDVADMIAFLASPAARGYHGACVSIDAGITAG